MSRGNPQIALEVEHRVLEARWHHADDVVWLAVHHEPPANDRRVATKAALPQSVTDHRDVGFSVRVFKCAAYRCGHAKQRERVRR